MNLAHSSIGEFFLAILVIYGVPALVFFIVVMIMGARDKMKDDSKRRDLDYVAGLLHKIEVNTVKPLPMCVLIGKHLSLSKKKKNNQMIIPLDVHSIESWCFETKEYIVRSMRCINRLSETDLYEEHIKQLDEFDKKLNACFRNYCDILLELINEHPSLKEFLIQDEEVEALINKFSTK